MTIPQASVNQKPEEEQVAEKYQKHHNIHIIIEATDRL